MPLFRNIRGTFFHTLNAQYGQKATTTFSSHRSVTSRMGSRQLLTTIHNSSQENNSSNNNKSKSGNKSSRMHGNLAFGFLTGTLASYMLVSNAEAQEQKSQLDTSSNNAGGIKPNQERNFVKLIKELAKDRGLECETLSGDWIIILRDPKTNKTRHIMGYGFGLNSQAASGICRDKSATSEVLKLNDIPHIAHQIFLNPRQKGWLSEGGVFSALAEYAKMHQYDVVVKPKEGSSGIDVTHCKSLRELERAVVDLFAKYPDVLVSPFEKVSDEFRVIMLDHEPQLVFKKVRPSLLGDGKKTVRELMIEQIVQSPNNFDKFLEPENVSKGINLDYVPLKGEAVLTAWKHNLHGGAYASQDFSDSEKTMVVQLATRASQVIGVRFAAVDVAKVDGKYKIMEVNGGVTIDKAPASLKDGAKIVRAIYGAAIDKMFEEPSNQNINERTYNKPTFRR